MLRHNHVTAFNTWGSDDSHFASYFAEALLVRKHKCLTLTPLCYASALFAALHLFKHPPTLTALVVVVLLLVRSVPAAQGLPCVLLPARACACLNVSARAARVLDVPAAPRGVAAHGTLAARQRPPTGGPA